MTAGLVLSILGLSLAVLVHTAAIFYWAGQLRKTVEGHSALIKMLPCLKPRGCELLKEA